MLFDWQGDFSGLQEALKVHSASEIDPPRLDLPMLGQDQFDASHQDGYVYPQPVCLRIGSLSQIKPDGAQQCSYDQLAGSRAWDLAVHRNKNCMITTNTGIDFGRVG